MNRRSFHIQTILHCHLILILTDCKTLQINVLIVHISLFIHAYYKLPVSATILPVFCPELCCKLLKYIPF